MAEKVVPMARSGFCEFPGRDDHGHELCHKQACTCTCHRKPEEAGDNAEDQ